MGRTYLDILNVYGDFGGLFLFVCFGFLIVKPNL